MSAQNAQRTLEKTKEKAEAFLVALHSVLSYFEANDKFSITEAKRKILEVEGRAYGLAAYVSFRMAWKSIEICFALKKAVESKGPEEFNANLKKVTENTAEWIKLYYEEVGKLESQSMPEKWKYDLFSPLLPNVLKN